MEDFVVLAAGAGQQPEPREVPGHPADVDGDGVKPPAAASLISSQGRAWPARSSAAAHEVSDGGMLPLDGGVAHGARPSLSWSLDLTPGANSAWICARPSKPCSPEYPWASNTAWSRPAARGLRPRCERHGWS